MSVYNATNMPQPEQTPNMTCPEQKPNVIKPYVYDDKTRRFVIKQALIKHR